MRERRGQGYQGQVPGRRRELGAMGGSEPSSDIEWDHCDRWAEAKFCGCCALGQRWWELEPWGNDEKRLDSGHVI